MLERVASKVARLPPPLTSRLQLLRLFCPDFPLELVTDACKLCGDGGGSFPMEDLLLAWRARFYYAEFLVRTAAQLASSGACPL